MLKRLAYQVTTPNNSTNAFSKDNEREPHKRFHLFFPRHYFHQKTTLGYHSVRQGD